MPQPTSDLLSRILGLANPALTQQQRTQELADIKSSYKPLTEDQLFLLAITQQAMETRSAVEHVEGDIHTALTLSYGYNPDLVHSWSVGSPPV